MSLADTLKARIAEEGALPLEEFMAAAVDAYYAKGTAFGAAGDFTTAPEVCQVFGEILGLWAVVVWQALGAPAPVRLVELGPGRGTLMADALRAAAKVPAFMDAAEIHLIERSPALRKAQRAALGARPAAWHDGLADVPDGPAIVLANEFFDALPIRQYERTPDGWHRRDVGVDADGRFTFVAGPAVAADEIAALGPAFAEAGVGAIAEVSPAAQVVAADLAGRLATQGGAALIVDYGYAHSAPGDSLQALKRHEYVAPLDEPGEVDLTAHVDFERLAAAAEAAGARALGPVTQARFLAGLGVEQRAKALMARATAEQAVQIASGVHRLIHPTEMGTLFKAMTVFSSSTPPPPGFERLA